MKTLCRVARAIIPDGDAAHTDFTVVCRNQEACLSGFTRGLVATEPMYKDRSFLMSCCLVSLTASVSCLMLSSSLVCSMHPYATSASKMA